MSGPVARLRIQSGLSQKELAERAQMSVRALRDIEQGRVARPHAASLARLAEALGLDPADLHALAEPDVACVVNVLGTLVVTRSGATIDIGSPKVRDLLGLLAALHHRSVPRGEIVDTLWPDDPPRTCEALVSGYIGHIRRLLEPHRESRTPSTSVQSTPGGYRLRLGPDQLDLARFERLVDEGRRRRLAGDVDGSYSTFVGALACWRGPVLADTGSGVRRHPAVVAAGQLRVAVALEAADLADELGRHAETVPTLRALADEDPLHEGLAARLMLALAAGGEQGAALDRLASIRSRLAKELGVEIGAELRAAQLRVLRGEVTGPVGSTAARAAADLDAPAQLPADIAGFAGRSAELDRFADLVVSGADRPVLCVVSGAAGVGKTTFAVHVGHRFANRFPDGQLFTDLRGFDPSGVPVSPDQALGSLLGALGVSGDRLPDDTPARGALFRSLLSGRRMLVVLDNARDVDHVHPLLPGSPGCLTVVTSRDHLTGLVAARGADALLLDVLAHTEARELLVGRIGRHRADAEPAAVDEIIESCARLPLALGLVGARAVLRPTFPLSAFAAELRDPSRRLSGPMAGARAAFSWSYRALNPPAATLFRLLGLHPAPRLDGSAVASLVGLPVPGTTSALAELCAANLIIERAPGRYELHDLVHGYATELATGHPPEPTTTEVVQRVLAHYEHTAHGAAMRLLPGRGLPLAPAPAPPGVTVATFAAREEALGWFVGLRPILRSVIQLATDSGADRCAVLLALATGRYLQQTGDWREQAAILSAAVDVAHRIDEPAVLIHCLAVLAQAQILGADYDAATGNLSLAMMWARRVGDGVTRGQLHLTMAAVHDRRGQHDAAVDQAERALDLLADAGPTLLAAALNSVAWQHAQLGDYETAIRLSDRALAALPPEQDSQGHASALHTRGYSHHRRGEHTLALASFDAAVMIYRKTGNRQLEAATLDHAGDAVLASGDPRSAAGTWTRVLALYEELGDPSAGSVRVKLGRLADRPPSG